MFVDDDPVVVQKKATFFSLMFAVIGGVSFITMFLQVHTRYTRCIYIVSSKEKLLDELMSAQYF